MYTRRLEVSVPARNLSDVHHGSMFNGSQAITRYAWGEECIVAYPSVAMVFICAVAMYVAVHNVLV